jgi:hypothetical protein
VLHDQVEEEAMGWPCSMHEKDKNVRKGVDEIARRKETSRKI